MLRIGQLVLLLTVLNSSKLSTSEVNSARPSFTIDWENDQFLKDGQSFRYVAGSMHYYNVPTELWRDRLQKMKYGGLNAIQTYIEWSSIERRPGVYDFSGNNNITRFIRMAQEEGLLVILRPTPYIDSERDMGGLPSWLLKANPQMKLRTKDPTYIAAIDKWFNVLLPMLRPLLYVNGGPVIMVQLENEYGSYTPQCKSNGDYKAYLRETFQKLLGNDIVLFTTDGNQDHFLQCGMIAEVFASIDFGVGQEDPATSFATLRRHQASGPLVNSEFYTGWFDAWESKHETRSINESCAMLDGILALNGSVSIYMYHGGTHWGFYSGALMLDTYTPVLTSYDYDAPISEAGDLTPKFYAIKDVIRKYMPVPESKTFASVSTKMELPPVQMIRAAAIFDLLPEPILADWPQTFEQLNHTHGYLLYSTNMTFKPTDPAILTIPALRDRAQVFVDKEYAGTLSWTRQMLTLPVKLTPESKIDILVENQGRISYGQMINGSKGILTNVLVDKWPLAKWHQYRIFDNWTDVLERLPAMASSRRQHAYQLSPRTPTFFLGTFTLPDIADYPLDSFLQVTGWSKGVVFLNGHNLGRYWPVAGPQETLYAPSIFFKPYPQTNSIVIFEEERSPCLIKETCRIQFVRKHVINGTVPFQVDKF